MFFEPQCPDGSSQRNRPWCSSSLKRCHRRPSRRARTSRGLTSTVGFAPTMPLRPRSVHDNGSPTKTGSLSPSKSAGPLMLNRKSLDPTGLTSARHWNQVARSCFIDGRQTVRDPRVERISIPCRLLSCARIVPAPIRSWPISTNATHVTADDTAPGRPWRVRRARARCRRPSSHRSRPSVLPAARAPLRDCL